MRYTVRPISDRTPFTGQRRRSPFSASWSVTERLLLSEVMRLRGEHLVLEVDVTESMIRIDGGLYANARPSTPAVRVAFDSTHGPLTYATDRFTHWQDNVRAVALGLEALRKVDRYGITQHGEQYTGWKAIGAGTGGRASHMTTDQARQILLDASMDEPSIAMPAPGESERWRMVWRMAPAAVPTRTATVATKPPGTRSRLPHECWDSTHELQPTRTDPVRAAARPRGPARPRCRPLHQPPGDGMRIVGLDLSLASTGVATIDVAPGIETFSTETIVSKGRKDATLRQRETRLRTIANTIDGLAFDADLVVVEGPSFGQARQGGQHDRAGLWWLVVSRLAANAHGPEVVEVPPASRCKYATGKGNAAKDQVLAAVVRRYPDVLVDGNDQADALVLAAMGARRLGHPIDDLPQLNLTAMDKVRWPNTEAVMS